MSALTSFHPLAWALYIVNELEATRKRSGIYFISWNSVIISISNGVSIWIRIRVHIHSFKSVIIQFHHTPLNVCLYLHIRVEIRPSFSIRVPLSETKRSDIISVSSLWIWRNLHAWILIIGFVFISIADQTWTARAAYHLSPCPPSHPSQTKN